MIISTLLRLLLFMSGGQEITAVKLQGNAQGTTWHITYYADEAIVGKPHIDSILEKIDSSLSLYKPYSQIVAFNNSQRGLRIDEHFKKVVERSLEITGETGGLSDLTIAPLVSAWGFGAQSHASVPTRMQIDSLLSCVGSDKIVLQGDSLVKHAPCVRIDANGIAQGYSVDVLADYLLSRGIKNYLVELGGELRVKGSKLPARQPFRIGIESPGEDEFATAPIQRTITLHDGAITTSGNYRRYHESGGKKYSHIIDPRTGVPADNEMISVSVFARDAITADAYDNALMLMGVEKSLKFVEGRTDLAAFIIYRKPDGTITDTASSRFSAMLGDPAMNQSQ